MTAITMGAPALGSATDVREPINLKAPIGYSTIGLICLVFFGLVPAGGRQTTFAFATANDWIKLPNWTLDSKLGAIVFAIIALAVAGFSWYLATKRIKAWIVWPVIFGISAAMSFLIWVAADKLPLQFTGLLQGGLFLAIPLVLGACAGLLNERSGTINVAIEGQLLAGAFLAAVVGSVTRSAYLGLVAAPVAGALVGMLLVWFTITYQVDHIIVGVVLNVLVVGLTGYLFSTVLTESAETWNSPVRLPTIPIPGLSQIPVLGPVLFRQNVLTYLMYIVVIALQILIFRSRWGVRMRSVGEHPEAADTVGIKVNRTRGRNAILGGAVAGLGGAFFTVATGLAFGREMTGGKGFIALAAMILGRWNPTGALVAALIFGLADNLQVQLGILGSPVPSQLLLMTPYIVTIFAVAGLVGKVRAPAAEGTAYVK